MKARRDTVRKSKSHRASEDKSALCHLQAGRTLFRVNRSEPIPPPGAKPQIDATRHRAFVRAERGIRGRGSMEAGRGGEGAQIGKPREECSKPKRGAPNPPKSDP